MKVFISWSGDTSKTLAEILRQWLPAVIQAIRPYYSPDDTTKGARWTSEIAKELEESRLGLLCLTRDNLEAPWMMFEAGALSKKLDKSRVCPILFGVEPTDIKGPLVQFQASRFEKTELKRVVRMMNVELGDSALANDVLDSVFEMWWPRLEDGVKRELDKSKTSSGTSRRSERDLLEEVLALTRSITQTSSFGRAHPAALFDMASSYCGLVDAAVAAGAAPTLQTEFMTLFAPLDYLVRHSPPGHPKRSGLAAKLQGARKALLEANKSENQIGSDEDDEVPF